jgi:DNA-binding NtrC family response regulator
MVKGHIGAGYTPPRRAKAIKPLDEILLEVELRLIETALRQSRSNKSRAADILGISRPRLYRRIKELGLPDDELVDES